ncbi:GAF domain-containing protein [Peribacillus frigoritolerans]|uniref:GAF domain-containing protein n=1 Tax=Peribacillus frigoritolerans TaxID=450367 RepID=UPI0032E3DE98
MDIFSLDSLYEKFSDFLKQVSWFSTILGIVIIAFLIILGIVIIYKVYKGGQELNIFNIITLKPNTEVQKLRDEFEKLNAYDKTKSNVLKLLNQTYLTLPRLYELKGDSRAFEIQMNRFYDFFLPGILTLITKEMDNEHRVAILVPRNNILKILKGNGYSPNGLKFLTLNIQNSKAGFTYLNKQNYFNNDLTLDPSFTRNPNSSRVFKSLICIPIEYSGQVIGILNIDGLKENSFEKDDVDFLTYFANAFAPLLNLQLENTEITIFDEEDKDAS